MIEQRYDIVLKRPPPTALKINEIGVPIDAHNVSRLKVSVNEEGTLRPLKKGNKLSKIPGKGSDVKFGKESPNEILREGRAIAGKGTWKKVDLRMTLRKVEIRGALNLESRKVFKRSFV